MILNSHNNKPTQTDKPKLLMVTHRLPFPPDKGERIRSWHMLQYLSDQYDIHLACPVDAPVNLEAWRALKNVTADLAFYPIGKRARFLRALRSAVSGNSLTQKMFYSPSLAQTINHWCSDHQFHAALAVCSSAAPYIADLDIPTKVLDLVDVDSAKWSDYAQNTDPLRQLVYSFEARRLKKYERQLASRFDRIVVTTFTEAQIYNKIAPDTNVTVVHNGVDLDYFKPHTSKPQPVAIFTGVLNYRPNVQGIKWLAKEVWPDVRRAVPNATLQIVGRDPNKTIRQLRHIDGIQVIGPVKDIREYLGNATLAVAPLQIARGIQNKVLEAMAMQKPVIATPQAVQGIGAKNGKHFYTANTPSDWIMRLASILQNPKQSQHISKSARQFVESNRQWNHCLQPLTQTLSPIDDNYIRQLHRPLAPAA